MRQDRWHVEDAAVLQDLDRRHATLCQAGLCLFDSFGNVNVDAAANRFGFVGAGDQEIVIARIRRVRRHNGADTAGRLTLPTRDEGGSLVDLCKTIAAEHRLPQQSASAGFFHSARGVIHVPVMIADGGYARFDHLQQTELHAPVDVFGLEVGFQAPDIIVEPAFQIDVFAHAAPQDHGHVGMGIDETGHRQLPVRVNDGTRVRGIDCAGALNGLDAIAGDQDIVVMQDRHAFVLQLQDVCVPYQ